MAYAMMMWSTALNWLAMSTHFFQPYITAFEIKKRLVLKIGFKVVLNVRDHHVIFIKWFELNLNFSINTMIWIMMMNVYDSFLVYCLITKPIHNVSFFVRNAKIIVLLKPAPILWSTSVFASCRRLLLCRWL